MRHGNLLCVSGCGEKEFSSQLLVSPCGVSSCDPLRGCEHAFDGVWVRFRVCWDLPCSILEGQRTVVRDSVGPPIVPLMHCCHRLPCRQHAGGSIAVQCSLHTLALALAIKLDSGSPGRCADRCAEQYLIGILLPSLQRRRFKRPFYLLRTCSGLSEASPSRGTRPRPRSSKPPAFPQLDFEIGRPSVTGSNIDSRSPDIRFRRHAIRI